MFSGIIIDKFGQLRDSEVTKQKDVKQTCFICGNSRELFDRKSDYGFQQHINKDHYLWNYVFFLAYLNYKETTEYTGLESYVREKLNSFDYTWFPIQRAAVLVDEEKKIQLEEAEFQELQDEVKKFNGYLKELNVFSNEIKDNQISQKTEYKTNL